MENAECRSSGLRGMENGQWRMDNGLHGQALAHSFCILHSAFSILLVVYVNEAGGFRLMMPDERGQVREAHDGQE